MAILAAMPTRSRSRVFYGWWIVAAGFANQLIANALLNRSYAAYIALLRQEFGWSNVELSAAYSMQQVENGILGPLHGWRSEERRVGKECRL